MILERQSSAAIEHAAVDQGMLTLRTAGLHKVRSGVTTLEELLRCIG
jgi:type II secretory ATPase GspE/PulE/Tfp pilus assembly ATPase PilB-like protein